MSRAVIEIKNLTIGYGERHVLSNVNATIQTGEIVGIIGRNGAGKSTLLKTIRGILPKHSGEVLFFHKKLEDYHEKELACNVRLMFQPSEEGAVSGAKMMVDNGVMDGAECVVCTHCEPTIHSGHVGIFSGDYMAACIPMEIRFHGKSAHATLPENGIHSLEYFIGSP